MKLLSKLAIILSIAALATAAEAVPLVGWDTSTLPGGSGNYGSSPFGPTSTAANVSAVGLTRGAGVTTTGTATSRAWGGNGWISSTEAAAITNNDFFTFSLTAQAGFTMSLSSIDPFSYRRSGTGPNVGELQYSLDGTNFTDITSLSYTNSTASGATLAAIDVSMVPSLQDVMTGVTVTFRVVNWGGTSSAGVFYVYDTLVSSASDLTINGTTAPTANVPEDAPPSLCLLLAAGLLLGGERFLRRKAA